MINPFKATRWALDCMFRAAREDEAPGDAKVAAVLLTPMVAAFAFVRAFFQKGYTEP